jgi:hypothetical protein
MGERRLGWNEEGYGREKAWMEWGRRQAGVCLYRGGHLAARVKILSLMAPYEGICEWIGKIRDLIVEECRKNERIDERWEALTVGYPAKGWGQPTSLVIPSGWLSSRGFLTYFYPQKSYFHN